LEWETGSNKLKKRITHSWQGVVHQIRIWAWGSTCYKILQIYRVL